MAPELGWHLRMVSKPFARNHSQCKRPEFWALALWSILASAYSPSLAPRCKQRRHRANPHPPPARPPARPQQSSVVETLNSGHLEAIKTLRETLMAHEWELHGKRLAMHRRAVQ